MNKKERDGIGILESLKQAGLKMTPEEMQEQKISFIMGSVSEKSGITREFVKSELGKLAGQRSEK